MKVVSYNINGIRASAKLGLVQWLNECDADIVCLQEVRSKEKIASELLFPTTSQVSFFDSTKTNNLKDKYYAVFNCGDVPGYAGTLILTKELPDIVFYDMGELWSDNEGRTTTIVIGRRAIINAYIPNGTTRLDFKMKYIEALTKFIKHLKTRYDVICVGDFNIAHNEIDLTHPKENSTKSVFLPIERDAFKKILGIGMTDSFRFLHPQKVEYSWRSYRSRIDGNYNNSKYRIDYILVDDNLKDKVVSAEILDLPYSDHLPVVTEIGR